MILVGSLCVLAAIGLLVAGLTQSDPDLVWASVAASGLGGVAVVAATIQRDRAGRRAKATVAESVESSAAPEMAPGALFLSPPPGRSRSAPADDDPGSPDELPEDDAEYGDAVIDDVILTDPTEETELPDPAEVVDDTETAEFDDPEDEPPEEDVEVADMLTVIDLEIEVLVVDLRPRYHLEDCEHLQDRETIAIPVNQAREDGFTPCAWCRPDAALATAARRLKSAES